MNGFTLREVVTLQLLLPLNGNQLLRGEIHGGNQIL